VLPANLCKATSLLLLAAALLFSCKKGGDSGDNGNNNGGGPNPPPSVTLNADSISNHLQFFSANKIPGAAPKASGSTTLKISFKDTLYLVDKIRLPIKFLHMDTTRQVTGVFFQVMGLSGGSLAGNYFDVPAVPQVDTTSDTVSIVMVGIDPANI